MPRSLGVAVVGGGNVAQSAYLPLLMMLRQQGWVDRVAVADVDLGALDQVQRHFAVECTTDVNALVEAPETDVVVVLTSMLHHGSISARALRAGKSVMVEKPMATSLLEAAELVQLSRESSGFLLCAPHVTLSPDYQRMLRMIRRADVGRPLLGRARYGWDGPDWGPWFYAQGGGPLFDLGVYSITSLTGLLGAVERVTAFSTTTRPERVVDGVVIHVQTDDTFQIVMQHESGALSTVTTAFGMQKYKGPALEVYGLEGTIQMLGDDWAPEGIELWRNQDGYWAYHESQSRNWPWTDGLSHLIDCVRSGTRPYVGVDQAYHVLEIMFRSMESSAAGAARTVESRFEGLVPRRPEPSGAPARVHDRTHAAPE